MQLSFPSVRKPAGQVLKSSYMFCLPSVDKKKFIDSVLLEYVTNIVWNVTKNIIIASPMFSKLVLWYLLASPAPPPLFSLLVLLLIFASYLARFSSLLNVIA